MTLPFSRPLLFLSLFVIFGTREALTQNAYWEQTIGAESRRVYDLATNASGVVFAGTDRGMYRLTVHDGVWEEINNGIPGMYVQVTDVVIGPTGDIFAVMPNQGLYRSTNDGENWQLVFWPTGPRSVTVDSDGLIYLGTCLNEGIPECFGCHDGYLYRSTDDGQTWTSTDSLGSVRFSAINSSGYVFAYGHDEWCCAGSCQDSASLFRSTDYGNSWTRVWGHTYSCTFYNICDYANAMIINGNGSMLLGLSDSVFLSSDDGASWTSVNSVSSQITDMIQNESNNLFVATKDSGVFQDFASINSGLTNLNVHSITIDTDNFLYAGTDGNGIFRTGQPIVDVHQTPNDFPTSFELEQNYPNPFNSITTIEFSLPAASFVTLTVSYVLGKNAGILISESVSPGHHKVRWNAEGLSSGVYFYRLQTASFGQTRKLLLLR